MDPQRLDLDNDAELVARPAPGMAGDGMGLSWRLIGLSNYLVAALENQRSVP